MNQAKKVVDISIESAKHYEKCILCNRLTKERGIFIPEKSGTLGEADGKIRHVIYAICWKHEKNEETGQEIEDYIYNNISNFTDLTKMAFGDIQ